MSEATAVVSFDVPEAAAGRRLDRFLQEALGDRSRSALTRWIRDGRVLVDGVAASKPGLALRGGSRIRVDPPPAPAVLPQAQTIPVTLLYQDDAIVVVNKPIDLVVHPGHGEPDGTLVNALLGMGVDLAAAGGRQRPGIVHRLDRDTSGVLVVAKTDAAYHALQTAFAERRVRKRYRALVWGRPDPASGTIDRGIGRSRTNPTKMSVRGTRGSRRHALTHYSTAESLPGFALLDIDIETGRTHQIRVHLQSIGHAVVGDDRYGGRAWRGLQDPLKRAAVKKFPGLALHAFRLAFDHPLSGKALEFRAPMPQRFEPLLAALREPVR